MTVKRKDEINLGGRMEYIRFKADGRPGERTAR
jgi:hypothetical protein